MPHYLPPRNSEFSESNSIDFLFVLPGITFYPSGGYKVVYELGKRLSENGNSVGILFLRNVYRNLSKKVTDEALDTYIRTEGKKYSIFSRIFNHKSTYKLLPIFRKIFGVTYKEKFGKIEIFFSNGDFSERSVKRVVANGWQTAFFVRDFPFTQKKYYFIQQEDDDVSCNGALAKLAGKTYSFDMKKLVINEEMAKRFLHDEPIKIKVGIDPNLYPMNIPSEERDPCIILMPLRKGGYKGAETAIQCSKLVKKEKENVKFVSFGNYDLSEVPDYIEHHGTVSDVELVKLYNMASIFVLPSIIEGTPLTPLEAMSAGAAVVSTNNKGIAEYVVNGTNGLLVPVGDPEALKNAILKLVDNPELRITLAAEGKTTASGFTYEHTYKDFKSAVEYFERMNSVDS